MKKHLEYNNIRKLNNHIKATKTRLATAIMKQVKPLMWESGYTKGGIGCRERMKLVILHSQIKYYKLPKSKTEFCGFTETNCLIVDDAGGGIALQPLSALEIKDLIKLYSFIIEDRYNLLFKLKNKN